MIKNNFDFLRLLFAFLVVVSHSYDLSGHATNDILSQVTNGQVRFSYLGVAGFFAISGFLVYQSMNRSSSLIHYFAKRFLRLYPGLFVILLLTYLLAPFIYAGSLAGYLNSRSASSYFLDNLLLFKTKPTGIDGIFENNPYGNVINGSLWTIPFEVLCYGLLALLYFIKRTRVQAILLAGVFGVILLWNTFFYHFLYWGVGIFRGEDLLRFIGFFVAGSVLAAWKIESLSLFFRRGLLALALSLFLVSFPTGLFFKAQYITIPLCTILFGISSTNGINSLASKVGDLSFGVYIYSFPVQQTLIYFFKFNYWELMICTIPITFALAYWSWHLIEKRALQFKDFKMWMPQPVHIETKHP